MCHLDRTIDEAKSLHRRMRGCGLALEEARGRTGGACETAILTTLEREFDQQSGLVFEVSTQENVLANLDRPRNGLVKIVWHLESHENIDGVLVALASHEHFLVEISEECSRAIGGRPLSRWTTAPMVPNGAELEEPAMSQAHDSDPRNALGSNLVEEEVCIDEIWFALISSLEGVV